MRKIEKSYSGDSGESGNFGGSGKSGDSGESGESVDCGEYDKKSADNGDDDWNYNCDCDDDNIDKIDYKYDQQTYKYYDFWVTID